MLVCTVTDCDDALELALAPVVAVESSDSRDSRDVVDEDPLVRVLVLAAAVGVVVAD